MKILAALPLLLLLPALGRAQSLASPQIMADVRAGNFTAASGLAAATHDPLVRKLVTFFRLTTPGGGSADEIKQFIAQNPDWPEQGLLNLRAAQAAGLSGTGAAQPTPAFLTKAAKLHAAGQDKQAASLWMQQGKAAMAAADASQKRLFWPAQDQLARSLLAAGDAKAAYQVVIAVNPPLSGRRARAQIASRDFLAGFLLLRKLHQPRQAATWFRDLSTSSTAVITQARAYYWLARSETGATAQADYARAAAWPDTYYGQLAAMALGDTPQQLAQRIKTVDEPPVFAANVLAFALRELPRAALLLMQMNDPHDATMFLDRAGQTAPNDQSREMAAKLALALNLPQAAVMIARNAGLNGQMLITQGWPMPYNPPHTSLPAPVLDGVMRQESSFDANAISGSGAVGLMQLMPSTARFIARVSGLPYHGNLFSPHENMTLGAAYLAHETDNFYNCLPLAIAAYNAGPGNVARWLAQNGNPTHNPPLGKRAGGANIIDWIEEIPFGETRNYVQRVVENIVIYNALRTGAATSPLSPWLNQ